MRDCDPVARPGPGTAGTDSRDYFVVRDGIRFAGLHVLLEFRGAKGLDDEKRLAAAFREAVGAAGATLLHLHMHSFPSSGGVSGVAVLAESHLSIHTWPERDYAALDIFMCGACDPYKAVAVLRDRLQPVSVQISEIRRGILP